MRFSGWLLLGLAAALALVWLLLGRLAGRDARWRWVRRTFALCLAAVAAALAVIEAAVIARDGAISLPCPRRRSSCWGRGVNGTQPSLSLRTRLDAALAYLERWPEDPRGAYWRTGLWRAHQRGPVHV